MVSGETSSSIVDLRKLLRSRFPHLRLAVAPRRPAESTATGVPALDDLLGGGLPRGEFTELIASAPGSGSAEVIHALLRRVAINRLFLALVDGVGSFDVEAVEPDILTRLFWVRCQKVTEALKATDLLLRDRNFSILALDLKLNPARELRQISASVWYRYARLLEQNQATVLVVTPQPLVGAARYRVALESVLGIEALGQSRAALLSRLRFNMLKSAAERNREWMAQAG
jgi:hypothetical protein